MPLSLRRAAVLLALALSGCATLKVQSEYDAAAPYASYHRYRWVAATPGEEQAPAMRDPAVRALVMRAIDRELQAKGLLPAGAEEQPDLLVSALGWSKDEIQVNSYGYGYSATYMRGPAAVGVGSPGGVTVNSYRDGTLILDLVDAKTRQVVWRGTATDTLDDPSEVRELIDNAVHKLLGSYPPKG
ncbi:MAG: DUF4136 domain-containing protein [Anaeromyxobacter sp.]